MTLPKRNYIDISKKNQKGIIDSDGSGSNFIFEQNEIANQRAEDLAKLKKEADLAKQRRDLEIKKREMELLVAKQKAEELKKQQEEERQLQETKLALVKQQQEDELAMQKKYLEKDIKQSDPVFYQLELQTRYKEAEKAKENPAYIAKKEELDSLLLKQKKFKEENEMPRAEINKKVFNKIHNLEEDPEGYIGESIANFAYNSPKHLYNLVPTVVNAVSSLLDAGFNAVLPKTNDEQKIEKLQADLKVFQKPALDYKHNEIEQIKNQKIQLYKRETNPLKKHQLEVEIWKDEQAQKDIKNTLNPSNKYVIGSIVEAMAGATDFDKSKDGSLREELNRIHLFPRIQANLSEFFSRRDLEDKYKDVLVEKPGETPEQRKARLDSVPKEDLELLKSYSLRDEVKSLIEPFQSFGARQATNMESSLDMVALMVATEGAGSAIGGVSGRLFGSTRTGSLAEKAAIDAGETAAVAKGIGAETASVSKKAFLEKGYIDQFGKQLLDKGTNKFLAKTATMALDGAQLSAKVQAMNMINPNFVNENLSRGSYIDRDENGEIKSIYLQDKYYDFMKRMTFGYDTPDGQHIDGEKDSYVKRAAVLNRIENRTTEQEEELQHIEEKLGKRTSLSQMTFEEDLEMYKPMSKLAAHLKGFRQNFIETATEVYTGPLLGKVGKGLTKLPGVGKYATKIGETYEKIGSSLATGKANVINSNKVFRYLDKNMTKINMPTFSGHTITGNAEEFAEEWIGSAANSLIDLDPKEFMDTTFDAQSNTDIGLQTAFMNLGFGAMSVTATNSKLLANRVSKIALEKNVKSQKALQKQHEDAIEENKKEIVNQKEALKDESLSDDVRATKIKLIEDLETQNLNSKGAIASIEKKVRTTRPFYQDLRDYTDARNEIRLVNNALRIAHLDSDVNKVMNLNSMSSTDLDAQKKEIERLKKEGVDTTIAEKILFNNVVANAIKTGTLKDLKSSLQAASAKGTLSAETQQSLQRAMQNVAHLEEVSEKYQKHPYLNKILGMESEAFNLSEEVESAKRNTANTSVKATEALKEMYPNRDFDLTTMFDDTDSTFSEAELKQMLASNDAIQNYKTAYDLQNKFQEQLVKTNKVIGIFKNEAKNEVNKKNVNFDIRKQLVNIQAANDKETDVNDSPMYLYDNSVLENENVKFDDKGKLIIDKGLIDYLFEINENNYVGDWRTSHKISKESYDELKDNYHNRIDMMEAFKKVQDVQAQEVTPEEQIVDSEFSPEEDTDTETNPSERIPVNSKKYKTIETATAALKQYEKPRKVKKGTHEVVQVDDYFIISKKLEEATEEETSLDLKDNGTIEVVNTEEEQEGFVAIEENYNEAMTDLLDSVFNEDVVFDMSIDNNENRFTPQQMELATAYLEDYYNEMSRKVEKKDITFEKLFDQMFHYGTNKKAVEMLLPMMAIVWRQKGNELTPAQQASLYNKYYGKGIDRAALEEAVMATFDNIYAETVVVEPVDTSLPEESQIIPSDSSTNYNDTTELEDEIQAALEADKQLSDKERQSITPKAAFSSVKYSTYVDEAGDVHRVSNATDFRDTSGVNFKELLDYDKYYTGYQAGVRMSTEEEWKGLSISNGRDADGNVQLIPFTDWLAGMEAIVPNFRETQEFIDRVPMFLLNEKGEKVSYLNDVAWYDTVNVYNPYGSSTNQNNPSEMWQRHINKGIENIRELRNNVKNGLDKVTIERNSEEGIYLKLKKEAGQPTISVSEANPQANIAVATSTTASGLQHNNKELTQKLNDGSAIFLNKPADIIQGHTYYISRIGTNVLADGRKVETYRAFEVLREVSEDQVETVRNAYKMFQKYTWAVKNKDQAKIQELTETFIKPILKATGIDISKSFEKNGNIVYTGITDFIKMYFQADKKALQEVGVNSSDIHFAYERLFDKYSNTELAKEANQLLSQHTSKIALKAKNMIEVDKDGRVTLLEKEGSPVSYEEYVKDNVKTNIKALNIGTAENPKYVTVIQPIINIIGNPVAQPETQTSEKIAETTKAIVEEIKATTEEAKNNPVQTEREITEEDKKKIDDFFNKLNINIDYEDIDEAIDNLDAINKLFNTSGNLDFKQEYAVKQFLIGKITGYLIDNKVDISKPISTEVKKEIFDTLKTEMDKIVQDRTAEVNAVKENLKTFKDDNTVSKITQTVNATLDNLKTLSEEYEAIFNKAFDKLKIDSKVIEEEEDGDNSNVGIEDKNYSKESIETDLKKGVTPNLRLFLNSISQYDKQGNKVTTYLGLDSYMEFNEIFNQLIKNIAIGIDIPSDYNMLIETLQKSKAPFIKDVLEKLANADQQVKNTFLTTFVKHSLNSKSAQYSNINNVTKLKILENDSNEGKRVVKKEYLNTLKMSGVYSQDGTVNLGFVKNLIDRYESLFKEYPTLVGLDPKATEKAQSEIRMLLEQSGLIMQDNTWADILNNKFYNKGYKSLNDLYTLDNGGLLKPIMKFLKTLKEGDIYDNEKNILSDLGGVTNAIIKLEVTNDTSLNSTSFRDSGKNISKLVPTKYITDKVADLKRSVTDKDNTLISDLQSLSFSKDSVILQLLADYPEFQSIFSISHVGLEAMKEAGNPVFGKTGITDISDLDYFLATFTGFQDRRSEKLIGATIDGFPIRIANMLNLTMSDKSTNTFLQTGVFDFMASPLSFTTNEQGDLAISQEVKDLMIKQLVKPELERIANFYNTVKATNISDYDKAAKIFHLVPLLNTVTDSKGIRLIDKMAVMDNIDPELLLKEYNQQFSEIIAQVVNEEVNHFKEITGDKIGNMFDSEYFTEINAERSTDKALYDFVLNSMIHQADLFKVFAGDISNYSKDKQVAETGLDNKTTDAEYISLNKQIGVNLGKRLALLIAPGNKIANSYNEKYHQVFLQDSVDISENAKYLMDLYYPEKDKTSAYSDLEKYDEIAEAINKYEQGLVEISPEILEKYKDEQERIRKSLQKEFPSIKDYFDIESTDAQEYTTVKEHVNILFRLGRLNIEQYKRIMDNIENDVNLSKEDLKFVLQPIKPVHTGTYINKNQDVNRVVYIKTSSFPLLKQFTGPTKLDALRVKMEELEAKTGNGVRASYKTGNKVGAVKSNNEVNPFDVQSLENIFNGFDATTNTFDENGMNNSVLTLDRNNFRIQQDVPFKSDKKKVDTVAMSTQFFKMLFGDGVIEEYNEKERDAFATFSLNGKMVTGKELYNHYTKSFKKLVDTKKKQLFRELEMSPEGEITNKLAFTQKLQEMLVKEATEKGYSLKSVRGLTIEKLQAELGYHYDFKTPLWLSTDSNRYESLLNSLITNRILQHKIPGNSYVAGSESGFRLKENLEGINESKIIYLNNYNGKELQGTHTTTEEGNVVFHKAQVFVPSKFKTSGNELIDLFEGYNEASGSVANAKYLKRNENGSLGLKEEMLDKELLNLFSFRTPTSSHVSGASIEIAGFLPSIQGDLMIVPKNFTKQKGLDYDVDKEGTYMLNHVTNKDGKVEVLTERHKYDSLKTLRSLLADENNIYRSDIGLPGMNHFYEMVRLEFGDDFVTEMQNEGASLENKVRSMELEYDKKLTENEFIKVHLAVYNNPSVNIQQKINKVLSIDVAKQQAKQLEEDNILKEKAKFISDRKLKGATDAEAIAQYETRQRSFTMLSYAYQKDKMNFGTIGKTAIGVYANATTLSSLMQQNENQITLADNGLIQIGDLIFDGKFGKVYTLNNSRSIADVLAERENIATDNEKEQVLTKVGINSETINVDALLTLAGFDTAEYVEKGKEPQTISLPFYLLSQPAITEFNETLKNSKGVLGKYVDRNALINNIVYRLSNKKVIYKKELDGTYSFVNSKDASEIKDLNGKILTPKNLVEGVKFNGQNVEVQLAAFMTFVDLNEKAKVLQKVQSVINTNDLGKSMVGSKLKYDKLKVISENGVFDNIEKLLGDFIKKDTVLENPKGYYDIGDYYIKPTTPQGEIVINGLHIGNNIFKDFFPFQSEILNDTVKEIFESTGKSFEDISEESYEEIIDEVKKYIFSNKNNNIFNGDIDAVRFDLFKDTTTHDSLTKYIHSLVYNKQNTKALKSIKENALLSQLSFNINFDKSDTLNLLSTMSFNNTDSGTNNQENLYNAIPELIKNNYKLPDRNGMPYNTRMLATDLVAYAYLEGGIQEATQFVKVIPVEVLETLGNYKDVKQVDGSMKRVFVTANSQLQKYNPGKYNKTNLDIFGKILGVNEGTVSDFTRQYFQQNPDKAKKVPRKQLVFGVDNSATPQMFSFNPKFVEKTPFPFINLAGSLYEHRGNLDYYKIKTIGGRGISEYKYGEKNVVNFDMKQKEIADNNETTIVKQANDAAPNFQDVKNINTALATVQDLSLSKEYEFLKIATQFLSQFQDSTTKFEVSSGFSASGTFDKVNNKVTLHQDTLSDANKTAMILVHEYLHSITSREVMNYYQSDGITLKTDVSIPKHVQALHEVFSSFREQFSKEIAEITEKKKGNNKDNYTEDEKNIYYAGYNIREFLAMALTSVEFQNEMNKVAYPGSSKNFMEKLLEAIMKIVDTIYPELKQDTLAYEAVSKSMRFVVEEQTARKSLKTIKLLTGEDLSLVNLSENQLGLTQIDTSKEVDNQENVSENKTDEMISNNLITFDSSIEALGIPKIEWDNLSIEEQERIKKCN